MTKFCTWVDINDLITCATFGDDRLKGLGWQWVEFPVFPSTCVVALTTLSHYRSSALKKALAILVAVIPAQRRRTGVVPLCITHQVTHQR